MYSWGAFDKYSLDIDKELELLKEQLKQDKSQTSATVAAQSSNKKLDDIDDILAELNDLIGLIPFMEKVALF